jgi:uncharacterized tellurite resistance protein B-like protein
MLDALSQKERMRLIKFVCSFAWADLEIRPEERRFVAELVDRLEFGEEERRRVKGWLRSPPDPDSVDPTMIPQAHRELFIEAARGVVISDGEVSPEEHENLVLFEKLLR